MKTKSFKFASLKQLLLFAVNPKNSSPSVKLWWRINEQCFAPAGITKKNGRVQLLRENVVGAIYSKDRIDPAYSYKTMKRSAENYPEQIVENAPEIGGLPCNTIWSEVNTIQVDLFANIQIDTNDEAAKALVELQTLLKNAKKLTLNIAEWGREYIESGLVLASIKQISDDDLQNEFLTGKLYVALSAVWVKGAKIVYDLDKEIVAKVNALYENNKVALAKAGLKFSFDSTESISTTFEYANKFYPVVRYGRITKRGTIKKSMPSQEELIIEDPDFEIELDTTDNQ